MQNQGDEILISQRKKSTHLAGLWEFPGGKVESGETVRQALARELKEELNVTVLQAEPLIRIVHQYEEVKVFLDVWWVGDFCGPVESCEGQRFRWISKNQLSSVNFPDANVPIINAINLPRSYAILNGYDIAHLETTLLRFLSAGIKLIQLRIKDLSAEQAEKFTAFAMPLCQQSQALLMVNSDVQNSRQLPVSGMHLSSSGLLSLSKRPAGYQWVAASCHDAMELNHAQNIGVDFAVLAPVLPTISHPKAEPLGWQLFAQLIADCNIPVFALGGMHKHHIKDAVRFGAQGIAGISTFL